MNILDIARQQGMSGQTRGTDPKVQTLADQARLIEQMAEGYDPTQPQDPSKDPRQYFPKPDGFLGFGRDTFSPEVEGLLSENARKYIQEFYGPDEITTPTADQGVISSMFTKMFGRSPTDSQLQRIEATLANERSRSGIFGDYERAVKEIGGYVPTSEELRGEAPNIPGGAFPSAIPEGGYTKYETELPQTAAKILERDFGIQATVDTPEFAKRARAAGNDLSQLERIRPGIVKANIGPILAEDFNAQFRSNPGDRQVTVEDLDVQAKVLPGDNAPVLSFMHPVTNKRTAFDPTKFEWGADISEWLPEALVIGGDVLGSIGGGLVGGMAGPKTAFLGTIAGGSLGALYGRYHSQKKALENNGWSYDPSQKAYVNSKLEGGQVISVYDLIKGGAPDAYWSAGGGVFGSAAFKVGRAVFSRGSSEILNSINEKEFIKSLDLFDESAIGKAMTEQGLPKTSSMVLEKRGDELLEEARVTGNQTLAKEAQQRYNEADLLRKIEERQLAAGAERASAQEVGTQTIAKIAGTSAKDVQDPDAAAKLGTSIGRGVQAGDIKTLQSEASQLHTQNRAAIEDLTSSVTNNRAAIGDLGESLTARAQKIFGDPQGTEGIYGQLNAVTRAAKQYGRKVFDVSEAVAFADKRMKGEVASLTGGLPGELAGKFGRLRGVGPLNYEQITNAIGNVRSALDVKGLSAPMRNNLETLKEILEGNIKKGLDEIDAQNVAQGKPTTLRADYDLARSNFEEASNIWRSGIIGDIKNGSIANLEAKIFAKDADPGFIDAMLKTYEFSPSETNLLRAVIERKYRNEVMMRAQPDKLGQTIPIPGGLKVQGTDAAENAHRTFLDVNDAWIKKLFPDDPEFSKFSDTIAVVSEQVGRAGKLRKAETDLRNTDWFGKAFELSEDGAQLLVREPQKMFDALLKAKFPTEALTDVQRVIKNLPKEDQVIATEQLKALAVRRILNPVDEFAGAKAGEFELRKGVDESIELLNLESGFFNKLFGSNAETQNIKLLLKEMRSVMSPGTRRQAQIGISEAIAKSAEKERQGTGFSLLGIGAKVYVGVLNKKARAFNLGRNFLASKAEQKVIDAVGDAEKLAKLVKRTKPSKNRLIAERAVSNILGISVGDLTGLLENYDALSNELPEGAEFPRISTIGQVGEL